MCGFIGGLNHIKVLDYLVKDSYSLGIRYIVNYKEFGVFWVHPLNVDFATP